MILIFGGVYQGKLEYALQRFALTCGDVYYCHEEDIALPEGKKIIYELDKWILALLKEDRDIPESLHRFMQANGEAVVICHDISCGVVPADALLRQWREAVGSSLMELSRTAEEVIRLFCGLPARLK